jgi:glycosyltransferase involved in cell wall biosynthesis
MFGKLIENLSFGITSSIATLMQQADIVFANTWPIFAASLLSWSCRVRRVPWILNVQDIHPEAASAIGRLAPNRIPFKHLQRIDRAVARRATALVAISQNFAEFYHEVRGVPRSRIHVVPNWLDDAKFVPHPRTGEFRRDLSIADDDFVVMYAGNIGEVAGVELLVDVAARMRDDQDVVFAIAGDGSRRRSCEELARSHGLTRIRFLPSLSDEQFCAAQGMADLMVLPTRSTGAISSVPSKLINYMLSARPVLAAVDDESDTARAIGEARCGACVPPDSAAALVDEIHRLKHRRAELTEMGRRARQYAQTNFSRQSCVAKLIGIIEAVAHTPAPEIVRQAA